MDDTRLFATGGYGGGSMMLSVKKAGDKYEVSELWKTKKGSQVHPPFIVDGHLYMLANENDNHKGEARQKGGLMCFDLDGNIKWNTGDAPFMGRGNMIQVEDKLLIQDGEVGYLRVVDPSPEGYEEVALADVFGKKAEVDEMLAKQEGRTTKKIPDFKFWSPMALSNGHLIMRGQGTLKCLDLGS